MDVGDLVDKGVRGILTPKKGRDFYEELSSSDSTLRMGLNENMLVDMGFASTILKEATSREDVRRYPAPKGGFAIKAVAENLGVWEDQTVVGNGSDEILDLVSKVFVGSGEALVIEPTFEMYRFYVGLSRGRAIPVIMDKEFGLDADSVLSAISEDTKVIFICSPNNPTGRQFSKDEVLRVVEESGRIVVLDEAYADFAPYSLVREATKYDNLLVLRTFSKAFGLAGLRVGYAVGDSDMTEWLRAAQSPFSVNSIAQQMVRLVFENRGIYDSFVKKAIEERNYLKAELQMQKNVEVFDSDANFLLFRVLSDVSSEEIAKRLKEASIEVRDRGGLPLLKNCLRVTVSTRENNLRFVRELEKLVGGST